MINILLLMAMLGIMLSSMMISGKVLSFLNFGDITFGRKLHMVSTIWCFLLISVHFGFHIKQIVLSFTKNKLNAVAKWLVRVVFILISCYGVFAFISRELYVQAFALTDFLFLPYGESVWNYLLDYFSVFVLFVFASHCLFSIKLFNNTTKTNKNNNKD